MAQARMLNQRKKAKKGLNSSYMTRARALRKLQIPLADFRKLCILKGVYPREPKRKFDGADKTYYHCKDIKYLLHEPVLHKFYEIKAFMKKHKKLVGRKEANLARKKEERKPTYTLHHIVKERYPQFDDALRDMDDALSMVALFQSLPATKSQNIEAAAISESAQLYDEFQAYTIQNRCLRKVFASIKGYYFQAEIFGQQCTWLLPHQFAQTLPEEVDFKVMMTFLEFYRTLMKFVNFKLFASSGMPYPPKKDEVVAKSGMRAAALLQHSQGDSSSSKDFASTEEGAKMEAAAVESSKAGKVFDGLKIFINREVPFGPLHFVARAGGAQVSWDGDGAPFKAEEATHMIVDRPKEQLKMLEGSEYVQPQWILDSFNCKILLPILDYAPGKVPPPHLSPFVDDVQEGYVPEQREVLNQLINQKKEEEIEEEEEQSDEEVEKKYQEELSAEQKGVWYSEFKEKKEEQKEESVLEVPAIRKKTKKEKQEEEEKARAKAMMTGKHRYLLNKIEKTSEKKKEHVESLEKKRKKAKFTKKLQEKK